MSVSTLMIGSGAATPVRVVNFSMISGCSSDEFADVGQMAGHRGGHSHRGAHQVGASAAALPAFEIAVRGGSAALAGLQLVGVHGEAHGAAGLTPVEAGFLEDDVQALVLRLLLHEAGAGHDHRVDAVGDLAALRDRGRSAQVLDPAVGAGADEDLVDL